MSQDQEELGRAIELIKLLAQIDARRKGKPTPGWAISSDARWSS